MDLGVSNKIQLGWTNPWWGSKPLDLDIIWTSQDLPLDRVSIAMRRGIKEDDCDSNFFPFLNSHTHTTARMCVCERGRGIECVRVCVSCINIHLHLYPSVNLPAYITQRNWIVRAASIPDRGFTALPLLKSETPNFLKFSVVVVRHRERGERAQ